MEKQQPRCSEMHYGDCEFRPGMQSILIHGKRGRILSVLYTAAGKGPHPTVILTHGIPGCERNLDLAQALRRAGFHVMTFHYSGCWGSDGSYSLSNNLEDTETVLDFILHDESCGIDKEHIYAVGHSLGGFTCGHLAAKHSEIKAAALLMPCDIGQMPRMEHEHPDAYNVIRDVLFESADWLNGTSGDALVREAFEHEDEFALRNLADSLKDKPLLCISGTLDTCTPAQAHCEPLTQAIKRAGGNMLERIEYPTDHLFSDYRLTIAENLTEFFKNQL